MIRDATPAEGMDILRLARACPCVGARIEVDWRIARQNPKVPYRFYRPGAASVLAVNTHSALLAGTPEDAEELALFLSFTDTRRLFSDGWAPPGWQREDFLRMSRPAGPAAEDPAAYTKDIPGFVPDPGPEEIISVLESGEGAVLSPAAHDRLYADLQIRRSRGYAEVCGIRGDDGRLAATAGAWALTAREAYIACVETRPEARGRGHAHTLLAALTRRLAGRTLTLICDEGLRGFYEGCGFSLIDRRGVMASPPP